MSVHYQLTLDEILDLFGQKGQTGFSEQDICSAEKRLCIDFPQRYRRYLLTYGKDPINQEFNQFFTPDEITFSYDCINEIITHHNFETLYGQNKSNPYYRLSRIPEDEWHTITENYLLICCENQGVWFAGYRLADLLRGISDPPVYITTNDDFIAFEQISDNTENFFTEALWPAIPGTLHSLTSAQAEHMLTASGINPDRLIIKNSESGLLSGTCYNDTNHRFYFYYQSNENSPVQLTIADVL